MDSEWIHAWIQNGFTHGLSHRFVHGFIHGFRMHSYTAHGFVHGFGMDWHMYLEWIPNVFIHGVIVGSE